VNNVLRNTTRRPSGGHAAPPDIRKIERPTAERRLENSDGSVIEKLLDEKFETFTISPVECPVYHLGNLGTGSREVQPSVPT